MRNIAVLIIKIYRNCLSILKLQPSCVYYPSCSEYAVQALKKHGFIRGSFLSLSRILRCHPFSHGGYDPLK